ncbi:hypothetical protein ASE92_17335 [Pedobacter sp. Leaf41]|uniref:hypothetical protein n=1 Tax=Pedobacter sp. Leaf41 TaxID=1736218 RepID=UPI000703C16A|nr:hypothetical protein [Pedobacter sp. Leaf41]KQN32369.1 hypothetical protein ASE92_17335 [Pedobacter sp. Leaf41]
MQNHPDTKHPLESYFTLIEENYISVIYSEFHDFDTFYSSFDPTIFNNASMVKNGGNYELRNGEKLIRVYTFDHHLQDFLNEWNKTFINEVRSFVLDKSEKEVADYTKLLQKEILQLIIRAEKKNIIAKTQTIKSLKS